MSKSTITTTTTAELSTGRVRAILALALVIALIAAGVFARVRANTDDVQAEAAGDLDPTFGNGGKIVTDFSVPAGANALAIQSDGKLIVAGIVQLPTGFDFGLARYNPDGSLDTSFGNGGSLAIDFFGGDDRALAVALQPDGKIVVAGHATTQSGGLDFALARVNSNGTIDTSFGSGGKITDDFHGRDDRIRSILILSDGRIGVAGFATQADGSSYGAAAVYKANGNLIGKGDDDGFKVFSALALQPDGKIILGGSVVEGQGPRDDFRLQRIDANFEPDPAFGNRGDVITDFGGNDDAFALALQPDGKIVAAGASGQAGVGEFALARYNTDGSLDSSFGSSGKLRSSSLGSPGKGAIANAVLIQPDNKIVAVGVSNPGAGTSDFTLLRYNADGTLDSTFGSGGQLMTDFFGSDDFARAALIQPDGKIVVAGFTTKSPGGPALVALARYSTGIVKGFSIGFEQATVTAERGTKARVNVVITRTGGFTGNVTVTPADPSGGIKPKPNAPMTTSDSSVVYKMKIGAGADPGPHDLVFTAKDDSGTTKTATVRIVVQ